MQRHELDDDGKRRMAMLLLRLSRQMAGHGG
jgi:hypothetical protein